MSLQKNVLERYRHNFPNDTLREMAVRTNLQLTRVHRLLKGFDMKVEELEKIEKALTLNSLNERSSYDKFKTLLTDVGNLLNSKTTDEIIQDIEKRIFCEKLKKSISIENNIKQQIC